MVVVKVHEFYFHSYFSRFTYFNIFSGADVSFLGTVCLTTGLMVPTAGRCQACYPPFPYTIESDLHSTFHRTQCHGEANQRRRRQPRIQLSLAPTFSLPHLRSHIYAHTCLKTDLTGEESALRSKSNLLFQRLSYQPHSLGRSTCPRLSQRRGSRTKHHQQMETNSPRNSFGSGSTCAKMAMTS